jgi:anti-sigma factor RsiW
MRSQISDQDLTDYALNELGPEERIYVESMLAVSEECRNDVYETIDFAMLLEEGFEREDGRVLPELTNEQRQALLNVRVPNHFFRRTAVILAAAAAVALAFVNKDQWMPKGPASGVARVSNYVAQAVSAAEGEDFVNQLASFRKLTEDPAKWLPSQPPAGAAAFGSGPAFNMEVAPRASLDLMP